MSKRSDVVTTLLAASLGSAAGLPSFAAGNSCTSHTYSHDSDPAGTNVRSGPEATTCP